MFHLRRKKSKSPKLFLDDLIRDQNWGAVRDATSSFFAKFRRGSPKMSCSRRCSTSALALAVSLNPPVDVVSSLLQLDPAKNLSADRRGRLPIHVACSRGASVDVVRLLLESSTGNGESSSGGGNQHLALCTDADCRVPLHYAAEYAVGSYGDTLDVVKFLCAEFPAAAFVEDVWGDTPFDVAAQMSGSAVMDGDTEMVESARSVERVLLLSSMMRRRRTSRIIEREGPEPEVGIASQRMGRTGSVRLHAREMRTKLGNDSSKLLEVTGTFYLVPPLTKRFPVSKKRLLRDKCKVYGI